MAVVRGCWFSLLSIYTLFLPTELARPTSPSVSALCIYPVFPDLGGCSTFYLAVPALLFQSPSLLVFSGRRSCSTSSLRNSWTCLQRCPLSVPARQLSLTSLLIVAARPTWSGYVRSDPSFCSLYAVATRRVYNRYRVRWLLSVLVRQVSLTFLSSVAGRLVRRIWLQCQ